MLARAARDGKAGRREGGKQELLLAVEIGVWEKDVVSIARDFFPSSGEWGWWIKRLGFRKEMMV